SAIKGAGSARWDRDRRVWLVDKADTERLRVLLDRSKEVEAAKAAAAQKEKAEKAAAEKAAGIVHIYRYATRHGGGLPSEGSVIKRDGEYHVVTAISKGRYVEDASSVGGSDERSWEFRLTLRKATEAEAAAAAEKQEAARRKAERARE